MSARVHAVYAPAGATVLRTACGRELGAGVTLIFVNDDQEHRRLTTCRGCWNVLNPTCRAGGWSHEGYHYAKTRERSPAAVGGKVAGETLHCTMCKERFTRRSSRHFKCPKCGAHFTEPAS